MGELIVPVILMAIGLAFYCDAGKLSIFDDDLPMTSATYPQILAAMVMACSAYLIIRFLVKRKRDGDAAKRRYFDPRVLLAFVLFAGFYFALPVLGYIPSAFILVMTLAFLFQKSKPRLFDTLVMPAALSVGLYYAFYLMSIYLPTGTIF